MSIVEKSFKLPQDNASTWRLVYAFISKEEQAKEEKTRQQNWEISEVPTRGMSVFMATFVVPFNYVGLSRKIRVIEG